MKLGIHVGHLGGPAGELRKLWRFAEERGFHWFSVSDHFYESPPQGGELDCLEAVSTMAAAAAETRRLRIGCLVFCVNYRHPGVLAKALATIDHLSAGRVECGLGAGWHEDEYRAYGIPFAPIGVREDQLEEYAQILRLLFDRGGGSFDGRHFQLRNAQFHPRPVQARLRIWIGGGGEKRTLRAAARCADGWNAPYLDPQAWRAKNAVLDAWCDQEGRDPRAIVRSANVGFYLGAGEVSAARHRQILQRQWGDRLAERKGFLTGTPGPAMDMIAAYRDAGVEQLNIAVREGPYDWEALEGFAELARAAGLLHPGDAGHDR
jgi:alkanesulfonate monooxygenase SsuD/methylene tetrahydromethanopterin reductase-like flavin-dependent oxidoreductase (luciferase family)